MLKRLAILALLFAFTIPAVSQRNQPVSERNSNQGGDDTQQSPHPAIAPITNNQTTAYYQQESKEQPHGWHKFVTWPEGITAWLLMLTLAAIVWQAIETRRAAKAALIQANHMVSSERAWLTVDVQLPQMPEPESKLIWIDVPITNRGQTPARMHSIMATPKFIPVLDTIADNMPGKLPPNPDYSDTEKLTEMRGYDVIVAPGDTFMHHVYIWPGEFQKAVARVSTLYVYATVEYFDTIGGTRHTTSFCSIYAVPLPNFNEPTGFTFSPYIPPAYYSAT